MTIPFKQVTNNSLQSRAAAALKVQKRISELTATLDEDKVFFRDVASGGKLNIDVPGVGSVSVKTGSAPSSGIATIFDEDKYNALPLATKQLLIAMGVVVVKSFTKLAGTPAVSFTLNK